MKIKHPAVCGTLESADIMIHLTQSKNGNKISLDSIVQTQFGEAIEALIHQILDEMHIEDVQVDAHDRGALDCTIRARMETAIIRALTEVTS